jgi:hypothetical protein
LSAEHILPAPAAVNVVVSLLPKQPRRSQVHLANGTLLVASTKSPFAEAGDRLLAKGFDPGTPLSMRVAGSDEEVRCSTVGNAANLKNRISAAGAKHGLTADNVPDGYDEVALIQFLKCLRSRAVPDAAADVLVAHAFPAEVDLSPPVETGVVVHDADVPQDAPVTPAAARARVAARFAAGADALQEPSPSTLPPVLETKPEPVACPRRQEIGAEVAQPLEPAEVVTDATVKDDPDTAPPPSDRKRRLKLLDKMAVDTDIADASFRSTSRTWRHLTGGSAS